MASYQEKRRSLKSNTCKPLSTDVRNVLRSGVAISSVVQCVEELVYNAIDAEGTAISVTVDLTSFRVKVEDNGVGLSKADFDVIGARHTTSKCSTLTDLNSLHYFGYRGEALASIIDISAGVELYTRTAAQGSAQPYYRKFKNGRPSGSTSQVSDCKQPSPGFTIIVHNLLSKLPVRQKRIDPNLEAEEIKKSLEQIYLISPNLLLTFEINGRRLFHTYPVKSVSEGLKQTYTKLRESSIHECFFNYDCFFFQGWFTKETHHSKSLQFVYVNKRFVGRCRIHRAVDSDLSEVIGLSSSSNNKSTNLKRNPKAKEGNRASPRGPDKYAIFVLNIQSPYTEYDMTLEPKKSLVEFKNWSTLLKGLEGIILKFKAELSAENKGVIVKSSGAAGGSRQKLLQGESGNLGTIHDLKRTVYSRVARREQGPGSPVFDSEGEDSPLAAAAKGSKPCHNSSDEEGMNSPDDPGPSKRSKMDQFKPKDKLRLGASFKSKPMDLKPVKRRKGEEPVIHGYKRQRLTTQPEREGFGNPGPSSKSILEVISEKLSTSLKPPRDVEPVVEPRRPPYNNPYRMFGKKNEELGSQFSRLSVSNQNSEYQFELGSDHNDTAGNDSFQVSNVNYLAEDSSRVKRKSDWDESDDEEEKQGENGSGVRPDRRPEKNPMLQVAQSIAEDRKMTHPHPNVNQCQVYKSTNGELINVYGSRVSSSERFQTSEVIINTFTSTVPGRECVQYSTVKTTYDQQQETTESSPRHGVYLSQESLHSIQKWLAYTVQYPNIPEFLPESPCPMDNPFDDVSELDRQRAAGHSYNRKNSQYESSQESSQELFSFSQRTSQQQQQPGSQPHLPEPPLLLPQTQTFDYTCPLPLGFPDSLVAPTPAPFRTRPPLNKNPLNPYSERLEPNAIHPTFAQPLQRPPPVSTDLDRPSWTGFSLPPPPPMSSAQGPPVPYQYQATVVSAMGAFPPPAPPMNLNESRPMFAFPAPPYQEQTFRNSNNFIPVLHRVDAEYNHFQTTVRDRLPELSSVDLGGSRFQSGFQAGRQTELNRFASESNQFQSTISARRNSDLSRSGAENNNFSTSFSTNPQDQSNFNRAGSSQFFTNSNSNNVQGTSFPASRPREIMRQSSGYGTLNDSGFELEDSTYFERSPVELPRNIILNPFSNKNAASSAKFALTPLPNLDGEDADVSKDSENNNEQQSVVSASVPVTGLSEMEGISSVSTGETLSTSTYFPTGHSAQNVTFSSASPRNGLPPLHPFKPNSDFDGEWNDDQIFDTSTSWSNWECDVTTDANGQEWLVTEDKEGYRLYINLKTGVSSYDMRSHIEPRRLTAKEAAEINPNFSYNWLRRYFPKGSKFWKPEKNHLLKNGNIELAKTGNTILGLGIQQCLNGTVDEAVASKWREGVLLEAQNQSMASVPDKGVVRVAEYWERPLASAELPVINLNAPEIHFWKSVTNSCRFSKEDLTRVKVLGQVDKKFIAAKARVQSGPDLETELLVLFDQHAVHERIRLEMLMTEIYVEGPNGTMEISSVCIVPPIQLNFSETEVRIMVTFAKELEGIGIKLQEQDSKTVNISSAPKCFAEKIGNEIRSTRDDTISRLIQTLLQEQVQHIIDTKGYAPAMPKSIFNILCSQACRGAIKFGDNLSFEACEELISKLKDCKMPFQCAHGRPVLTPLLDLKSLEPTQIYSS